MDTRLAATGGRSASCDPEAPAAKRCPPVGQVYERTLAVAESHPEARAVSVASACEQLSVASACERLIVQECRGARAPWPCRTLIQSPDGRWLACAGESDGPSGQAALTLYQLGERGLDTVLSHEHGCLVPAWMFSADSRTLTGLDSRGHWLGWCVAPSGDWVPVPPARPLCPGPVIQAHLSTSGHCLAVGTATELALYGRTGRGDWHKQWSRLRHKEPLFWRQSQRWDPVVDPCLLSPDGRHFLFSCDSQLRVCSRQAEGWCERPVRSGGTCDLVEGAAFDPAGSLLALACLEQESTAFFSLEDTPWLMVQLWHLDAMGGQDWKLGQFAVLAAGFTASCLVFSPDSQMLAFPEYQEDGQTLSCQVYLTSARQRPAWRALQCLAFEPRHGNLTGRIYSLQFSANSRRLVACSRDGAHIWQQAQVQGWVSIGRIAPAPGVPADEPQVVWSPDDEHLAFALPAGGQISVWGPGAQGHYISKTHFCTGKDIRQLVFGSGGRQLVVSTGDREAVAGASGTELSCAQLVAELEAMDIDSGTRS